MQPLSRRHFFYSAGMALTAAQATRVMGANDRVHIGIVGLGGRGQAHMKVYSELPDARIVALCDVNQEALERGQAKVLNATREKPKGFADMLEVFADKDVQAVSMPLPNHWHALATIRACQHGKDVYVEKPACHNVFEGQRMIDAARKYNRVVQVGSQGRSAPHKIKAIGLLNDGVIGKIYLSKGLCYKRRKSIGHTPDSPTPPGLDWDKFLGPAPMRPFNQNRFHYNWHWFWDTGNGDIGNQGIHQMDIARWGFGRPGLPMSVVSTGGKYVYQDDQETPNTQIATFNYGDGEIMFEVRGIMTGNEGGIGADRRGGNVIGNLFYGSEGWMALDDRSFQVYKGDPAEKTMDEKAEATDNPHFQNFLNVVKSRDTSKLNAEVAVGVQSANLVHLANASYRVGRELKFDEKTLAFPNDPEATALLTRKYRAPYIVPEKV
jgi:predicted dehydrogenase